MRLRRMVYEWRCLPGLSEGTPLENALNQLSSQGWEIFQLIRHPNDGNVQVIARRPRRDKSETSPG